MSRSGVPLCGLLVVVLAALMACKNSNGAHGTGDASASATKTDAASQNCTVRGPEANKGRAVMFPSEVMLRNAAMQQKKDPNFDDLTVAALGGVLVPQGSSCVLLEKTFLVDFGPPDEAAQVQLADGRKLWTRTKWVPLRP